MVIFPDLGACYIETLVHSLCSLDFRCVINLHCLPGNFCIQGPDEYLGLSRMVCNFTFKSEQSTGVDGR